MEHYTQGQMLPDYIYLEKNEEEFWISIEDCVELAIKGLEVYVHESEERLIQAVRRDKIDGLEAASVLKRLKRKD